MLTRNMRCFLVVMLFSISPRFLSAQPLSWMDSSETQYQTASRRYDSLLLQQTATLITRHQAKETGQPRASLLLGMTYWRLALIAHCTGNGSAVKAYGAEALDALERAEKGGADGYLTACYQALTYQLLAGLGGLKAARYGPASAAALKKARAVREGYLPLLIEAIQVNQAPSFVGGNPERAVLLLKSLSEKFPDSLDTKIHLADALLRSGRQAEARGLILPITKAHPYHLLAQKVARAVATN